MTCIVGYVDKENDKVYIGSDSIGADTSTWMCRTLVDSKLFKKGDMIFGATSSFRMIQIIQYNFEIPKQPEDQDDLTYLCSTFIDALMKCFQDKGFARKENDTVTGGTFLIGYKGNLYTVQNDFSIMKSVEHFESCGCGEPYAVAAMKVLDENTDLDITTKIEKSLEAAEHFSAYVRGPFKIISI